ncbi:hypothetical protein CYLTODRAFT_76772 [Cylindrobasidium torrendii FP15055 ss-10]|uniref:Protein CMS1 n=1 Tax=Cylindrobasidium torrendii FP15055 ss-10 TaxID=1314674 RepID=A0A0D7B376_9AGAR|nr:hypothetical protein CYLTODRAFT_76772 [Cylindrobasidium torrendii FP15055 ss-10]
MATGGDDLDDNLLLDEFEEDVPAAEVEDAPDNSSEDGNIGEEAEEDQRPTPKQSEAQIEKKRKRREKDKQRKKRKIAESGPPVREELGYRTPEEQSDGLFALQKKCFTDLSTIELDEKRIPASAFANTSSWTQARPHDELVDFIAQCAPSLQKRLGQKSKSNGAPTLLFITPAANRATDVARVLKTKALRGEKGGEVAKLFARHFKLHEHASYLLKTKVGAAVGTPGRVGKLLTETESLSTTALSHIILDVTLRDAKERTLFDIPETRDEVFKTVLGIPQILKAIKEGKVEIVLF